MDLAASRGYRPEISRRSEVTKETPVTADEVRPGRLDSVKEMAGTAKDRLGGMASKSAAQARTGVSEGISRARAVADKGVSDARDVYQGAKSRVEAEALRRLNAADRSVRQVATDAENLADDAGRLGSQMATDAENLADDAGRLGSQVMADIAENIRNMGESARQEIIDRGLMSKKQMDSLLQRS